MVIHYTKNTPKRIVALASRVAVDFEDEMPGSLDIKWMRSRPKKRHGYIKRANITSSGVTWCLGNFNGRAAVAHVKVTAGTSWLDAKMVFLHEMAHALTPSHHHDAVFWDKAFELYRWAKLPMLYCRKREVSYKKGAASAYKRNRRKVAMQKGTSDD